MNPKLKPIVYGLGVFAVYIVLTIILRLITGRYPENPEILGFFKPNDIWLGIIVAVVLTISHERKKRLK